MDQSNTINEDINDASDVLETESDEEIEIIPGSIGDVINKYIKSKTEFFQNIEVYIDSLSKENTSPTSEEIDRLNVTDDISEVYDSPYKYNIELLDKISMSSPMKEYVLNQDQKIKLVSKVSIGLHMYTDIKLKHIDLDKSITKISEMIEFLELFMLFTNENLIIHHLRPGCAIQPSKYNNSDDLESRKGKRSKRNNNKREVNITRYFNDVKIIIDLLNGKPYTSYNLNLELNIILDRFKSSFYKYLNLDDNYYLDEFLTSHVEKFMVNYYSDVYVFTCRFQPSLFELLKYIKSSLDNKLIVESDENKLLITKIVDKLKLLYDRTSDLGKDLDTSIINIIEIVHSMLILMGKIYTNKIYRYVKFRLSIENLDSILHNINHHVLYIGNEYPEEIDGYFQVYSGNSSLVRSMIDNNLTIQDMIIVIGTGIYDLMCKILNDHVLT
jgi:hypothetical protein